MSDSSAKVTALVTGGSRGIGVIYADRLAKRGYNLILVGRSETQRRTLSARLTKETGRSVTPLITMLVNNAGIGSITPLLNTEVDKTERIPLLITALTRLTYAAPPAFVARSAGTIINIASVVGISPETLNGVYGATKAYVVAFSLSLQHELADKGIRIQAELPGVTATTSGKSPAFRGRSSPHPSSCRRKTWSMQRWSGWVRENWLQFLASMMETNGLISRLRAALCRSGSATRRRHPDTGLVFRSRHSRPHRVPFGGSVRTVNMTVYRWGSSMRGAGHERKRRKRNGNRSSKYFAEMGCPCDKTRRPQPRLAPGKGAMDVGTDIGHTDLW
jgi:short-subunit dehydrogenase